ncbi:hypothetical protein QJS04_geneDACA021175 [Acorus gramineus]|uniref:Uncharacterized protein n=1 Tax=Acorus gramineus TaxID=55184 RepID=A0AAV9ABI6_ACOGR|nr:hypothetical protein QJS04_geneDACA021175 [Acorus gramineus]
MMGSMPVTMRFLFHGMIELDCRVLMRENCKVEKWYKDFDDEEHFGLSWRGCEVDEVDRAQWDDHAGPEPCGDAGGWVLYR